MRLTLATVLLAILLTGAGCGSGSDSSGEEVTVRTGSLSRAEFIKRADAICAAARSQFSREYTEFAKKITRAEREKRSISASNEDLVEKILIPSFQRDIDGIGNLGAPRDDEQEVAAFLNALQQRLEEIRERPGILGETATPFAKAEKLARKYGLTGCSESFS